MLLSSTGRIFPEKLGISSLANLYPTIAPSACVCAILSGYIVHFQQASAAVRPRWRHNIAANAVALDVDLKRE